MNLPHWQHFLSLEKEFISTLDYVELHDDNSSSFSINYTKLLLSICSEIDVVAKLICKSINSESTAWKITHYRNEITAKYPDFGKVVAEIPRYGKSITPWETWLYDETPNWWVAHNSVKHQRDEHYQLANQNNVIYALSALFCIVLYLYHENLYDASLEPLPSLLNYPQMPSSAVYNLGASLPNIPRV